MTRAPGMATIDGLVIHVRLLGPGDSDELEREFSRLSRKTILSRFHDPIRRLSPAQLRYLTHTDNRTHVALCAHCLEDGVERGLGVARYVAEAGGGRVAEFAVTIVDRYQNRGIGQHLLRVLGRHARDNGIRILRGYVQDDNGPMLRVAEKHGGITRGREGSVRIVELPIPERQRADRAGPGKHRAGGPPVR